METINLTKLASIIAAYKNCVQANSKEWQEKHKDYIDSECEKLPSGSGIDSGTQLILEDCTPEKLVFTLDFHNMNENGYYDGWTSFKLIVTPSFSGYNLKITGKDRNQVKDYLYDLFYSLFSIGNEVNQFTHF